MARKTSTPTTTEAAPIVVCIEAFSADDENGVPVGCVRGRRVRADDPFVVAHPEFFADATLDDVTIDALRKERFYSREPDARDKPPATRPFVAPTSDAWRDPNRQ
jgi:hypothetical protein